MTDTINIPREVVEQALEALRGLQTTALTSFYTIGCRDKALAGLISTLSAAAEPVKAKTTAMPQGMKITRTFLWDGVAQRHVPQLLIDFEPVPAGIPNDEKGWADRNTVATMLAASLSPAPAVPDAAKPDRDDDAPAMTSKDYAEFWERLPGHLIDNHEGEELTEELLQRAASDLYAKFTDLTASERKPFGLLLLEERATTRQLVRALREATEPPTFMGEPVRAAKPETQGERAELIERLNALAELCGMATGGWDLPESSTAKISSIASKAAALLSAGPARVEPLTDEQCKFLRFLDGQGEFMGVWFGEDNQSKRGRFWWRQEMKRLFPAHGIGKDQGS